MDLPSNPIQRKSEGAGTVTPPPSETAASVQISLIQSILGSVVFRYAADYNSLKLTIPYVGWSCSEDPAAGHASAALRVRVEREINGEPKCLGYKRPGSN